MAPPAVLCCILVVCFGRTSMLGAPYLPRPYGKLGGPQACFQALVAPRGLLRILLRPSLRPSALLGLSAEFACCGGAPTTTNPFAPGGCTPPHLAGCASTDGAHTVGAPSRPRGEYHGRASKGKREGLLRVRPRSAPHTMVLMRDTAASYGRGSRNQGHLEPASGRVVGTGGGPRRLVRALARAGHPRPRLEPSQSASLSPTARAPDRAQVMRRRPLLCVCVTPLPCPEDKLVDPTRHGAAVPIPGIHPDFELPLPHAVPPLARARPPTEPDLENGAVYGAPEDERDGSVRSEAQKI
ncbi:hypothetical protein FB451DRAFT_1556178 [Mycena latifolia]|nr:hypothetical protein FB451DRAFT_1556178 [Mycena latifolia]